MEFLQWLRLLSSPGKTTRRLFSISLELVTGKNKVSSLPIWPKPESLTLRGNLRRWPWTRLSCKTMRLEWLCGARREMFMIRNGQTCKPLLKVFWFLKATCVPCTKIRSRKLLSSRTSAKIIGRPFASGSPSCLLMLTRWWKMPQVGGSLNSKWLPFLEAPFKKKSWNSPEISQTVTVTPSKSLAMIGELRRVVLDALFSLSVQRSHRSGVGTWDTRAEGSTLRYSRVRVRRADSFTSGCGSLEVV